MREVAELAGVSVAAVSRYLNGGYISGDKAARIQDAIDKTGYVRSNQARSLRTGSTRLVGVVVPKINSESISRLTAGVSEALQAAGYQMLLANTANDPACEIEYLELLQRYPVDGIILAGTVITPAHERFFTAASTPVVVTGQYVEGCNCVYFDDYEAARDMGRHAARVSSGPVAYIGVTRGDAAAGVSRENGFRAGLADEGVMLGEGMYRESPFSVDGGYECACELLNMTPRPCFIGCATDTIAAGALRALTEAGVENPTCCVSGFGDNQLLRTLSGGIATIHFGYKTCGATAARMTLDAIGSGAPDTLRQVKLKHSVILD